MELNETYYTDLITKYASGEISEQEVRQLEAWVKSDPANAGKFREMLKVWNLAGQSSHVADPDIDEEWNILKSRISQVKNETNITGEFKPVFHIADVTDQPSLTGRRRRIFALTLRIAAGFMLLMLPAYFLYKTVTAVTSVRITAAATIKEVRLPDGTLVVLNSGSTLEFPSEFTGHFRRLSLRGQAWFDVTRDPSRPFIIASEDLRIRVAGTSFFVDTKISGNSKEVILEKGGVRIYYDRQGSQEAILLPGDRAEADLDRITRSRNTDENYLAWKTHHIVFRNTPLKEAARVLTAVYKTPVTITGSNTENCLITATFDRQSLGSVMNVLKATLDLQIRDTGKGMEISGDGCK